MMMKTKTRRCHEMEVWDSLREYYRMVTARRSIDCGSSNSEGRPHATLNKGEIRKARIESEQVSSSAVRLSRSLIKFILKLFCLPL